MAQSYTGGEHYKSEWYGLERPVCPIGAQAEKMPSAAGLTGADSALYRNGAEPVRKPATAPGDGRLRIVVVGKKVPGPDAHIAFTKADVVRRELVGRIVEAYESAAERGRT